MTKVFYINEFEGPLDLLLHLVKTSKMDIYEINTTEIINQYLEYIHQMEAMNIDVASEYLVMAAELVHLKSRLLINQKEEEEESEFGINSEEDLKNKLLEYQLYKGITSEFRDLQEKRSEVYTKLPEKLDGYADSPVIKYGELSVDKLLEALRLYQERLKLEKPLNTKITRKEISVEQRVTKIKEILDVKGRVNFLDLFDEFNNEYIIATFLAILQMSKNKELIIEQEDNFKPIMVEKRG